MNAQTKTLSQFKAIIFDVYGTLMDWESGIFEAFKPLLEKSGSAWSREETLKAFSSAELDLQTRDPDMLYSDLLAAVHSRIAESLSVKADSDADAAFGKSIANWPVFPDTVDALATLKKHYKLVVLSNVDNTSFDTFTRPVLEPNGHGSIFDLVITAQDLKAYKPNPIMFESALARIQSTFGIPASDVIVVAQSLTHDHKPSNVLGISSAWIDREGALTCFDPDAIYDFRFTTLGELVKKRDSED